MTAPRSFCNPQSAIRILIAAAGRPLLDAVLWRSHNAGEFPEGAAAWKKFASA
jgi:hypothetical protein